MIAHINDYRVNKVAELLPWHVAAKLPRSSHAASERSALAARTFSCLTVLISRRAVKAARIGRLFIFQIPWAKNMGG